ncbi:FMN-dependent NADH-azoreductase [Mycoplasmopsis glycophila]|uniref:FMN-dependent NADH-azoreductase n=1 Tax=Mycoplasmopsis glycophila TaxID=171285 RepID=A0A449AUY1_9BACT|nr:FMN-dependent NADH-azoreductase [Mycoplasmopsis glycophila]VEU70298.1 FMN-dependent NADH-azoreductase [Mycoplasmopsis glycophila]
MKKILFLDGNLISNEKSYSWHIMNKFHEIAKNSNKYEISRFDLNKTKHGEIFLTKDTFPYYYDKVESDFWINKLKETDILVISCSMINFAAAPVVKNFVDSIAVANKTFSYKYSAKGDAIGLLTNINVIILGTQGAPKGWYPFSSHIEWLKGTFKFLGAKSVEAIEILGTKVPPISQIDPDSVSDAILEKFSELINK